MLLCWVIWPLFLSFSYPLPYPLYIDFQCKVGGKAYNFIFPHTIELIALWNLEMAKPHTSLPIHFLVPWTFCSKPCLEVLGRAERASTEVAIPSLAGEWERGTCRLFSPGYPWIITLVMWPVMLDPRNLPAPGTAFFLIHCGFLWTKLWWRQEKCLHLSHCKRTFWLARDIGCFKPLVPSSMVRSLVLSSGPLTLFSTKGPTHSEVSNLTRHDRGAPGGAPPNLTLSLFF